MFNQHLRIIEIAAQLSIRTHKARRNTGTLKQVVKGREGVPTERAFNPKYHAKRKSRTNYKSLERIYVRIRVYLKNPDKVIVNDSKQGFLLESLSYANTRKQAPYVLC